MMLYLITTKVMDRRRLLLEATGAVIRAGKPRCKVDP
jgi:hypothetical protein